MWYFGADKVHDHMKGVKGPSNVVTEFLLFFPNGSRSRNPFPFNAKALHDEGFNKRLFTNQLMVPHINPRNRIKAGPDTQNPKEVLDNQQQQPITWLQMLQCFNRSPPIPLVLNPGSGVGVFGSYLNLFFSLFYL